MWRKTILNSYQAKIVGNQVQWLEPPPNLTGQAVIVTVLSMPTFKNKVEANPILASQPTIKRRPPPDLKGVVKIHGDIVNVPEMTARTS